MYCHFAFPLLYKIFQSAVSEMAHCGNILVSQGNVRSVLVNWCSYIVSRFSYIFLVTLCTVYQVDDILCFTRFSPEDDTFTRAIKCLKKPYLNIKVFLMQFSKLMFLISYTFFFFQCKKCIFMPLH